MQIESCVVAELLSFSLLTLTCSGWCCGVRALLAGDPCAEASAPAAAAETTAATAAAAGLGDGEVEGSAMSRRGQEAAMRERALSDPGMTLLTRRCCHATSACLEVTHAGGAKRIVRGVIPVASLSLGSLLRARWRRRKFGGSPRRVCNLVCMIQGAPAKRQNAITSELVLMSCYTLSERSHFGCWKPVGGVS